MDMKNLKEVALKHKELLLPPYGEIITMDGFGAVCALSQHFYGEIHLMPSVRHIFSACIKQEVIEKYKTHRLADLSKKYDYSVRTLRKWIDTHKKAS